MARRRRNAPVPSWTSTREILNEEKRQQEISLEEEASLRNEQAQEDLSLIKNILSNHVKNRIKLTWSDFRLEKDFDMPHPKQPTMCVPFPFDYVLGKLPGKWVTRTAWDKEIVQWQNEKDQFENHKKHVNENIDSLEKEYYLHDPNAIEILFDCIVSESEHPIYLPNDVMIEYKKADRLLIIYMFVPNKDCLPKIKEVRYVKTQKKIKEIELNKTESNMLFEHAAYSICLRAISEVFYNDANNDIDIVSFTGYVRARDLATGRIVKPPIFSVDVNVSEFRGLILEEVDPKQCFLKLKRNFL